MIANFIITAKQVAVLFLLIITGFALGKGKILNDAAIKPMNWMILNMITPCIILNSFQNNPNYGMVKDVLLCFACSFVLLFLFCVLASLVTRKMPEDERPIYTLSCVLSNCGFVGFPLDTAIIGSLGVFYGSGYVAIMNFFLFTFGYWVFTHDKASMAPKKLLTCPGLLFTVLAMVFYLLHFQLPGVIKDTLGHISSMCTPLPMMVVGYYLSQVNLKKSLSNGKNWLCTILRLVLFPLLSLALLVLCGIRGNVLIATVIAAGCPAASSITVLAGQHGEKGQLAAEINAMQTLLSMFTVPLVVAVAMMFM